MSYMLALQESTAQRVIMPNSERDIILHLLCFPAIQDDERLSAEEMDERRRQNIAYEYLCHLEEAKR